MAASKVIFFVFVGVILSGCGRETSPPGAAPYSEPLPRYEASAEWARAVSQFATQHCAQVGKSAERSFFVDLFNVPCADLHVGARVHRLELFERGDGVRRENESVEYVALLQNIPVGWLVRYTDESRPRWVIRDLCAEGRAFTSACRAEFRADGRLEKLKLFPSSAVHRLQREITLENEKESLSARIDILEKGLSGEMARARQLNQQGELRKEALLAILRNTQTEVAKMDGPLLIRLKGRSGDMGPKGKGLEAHLQDASEFLRRFQPEVEQFYKKEVEPRVARLRRTEREHVKTVQRLSFEYTGQIRGATDVWSLAVGTQWPAQVTRAFQMVDQPNLMREAANQVAASALEVEAARAHYEQIRTLYETRAQNLRSAKERLDRLQADMQALLEARSLLRLLDRRAESAAVALRADDWTGALRSIEMLMRDFQRVAERLIPR